MFVPKKVDPLVGIATSVMKEGDLRRGAEKLTNETLGVFSRRELPHERYAEYDALLVQNVDQALGKAKTLTEETQQPVTINETRQQTLERFIREQKKYSKKDVADFKDFEHGDKSGGKEKTYTHVHKTSGKEVVTTKPSHGSDWGLKEDNETKTK